MGSVSRYATEGLQNQVFGIRETFNIEPVIFLSCSCR